MESHGGKLLPAPPGTCPRCAVDHPAEEPHNRDSLFYQYDFRSRNGRWPVWKDAISHCSLEMQVLWEQELRKFGAWKEPGPIEVCPMEDGTIGTVTIVPLASGKKKRRGGKKDRP